MDNKNKSVFVCEDHFESTDFDANNEIKIRYREEGIKIMLFLGVSFASSAGESFPSTSHWLTLQLPDSLFVYTMFRE